jgi:hypothetical protein
LRRKKTKEESDPFVFTSIDLEKTDPDKQKKFREATGKESEDSEEVQNDNLETFGN